jgi:hypothetical protein
MTFDLNQANSAFSRYKPSNEEYESPQRDPTGTQEQVDSSLKMAELGNEASGSRKYDSPGEGIKKEDPSYKPHEDGYNYVFKQADRYGSGEASGYTFGGSSGTDNYLLNYSSSGGATNYSFEPIKDYKEYGSSEFTSAYHSKEKENIPGFEK